MIDFIDETGSCDFSDELVSALNRLMLYLELASKELCLVLVNDIKMQELNLAHRQVDAPTDVLSFPTFEPDDVDMPAIPFLGDIIISLDTAAKQAIEQGHEAKDEVKVLAAHGLTHLLGFDHPDEASWEIFKKNQAKILELT